MNVNNNHVVSSDPFDRIHEELHDLIYQHLDGKDILNASQVSSLWYESTSFSKASMALIELKIPPPSENLTKHFDVIDTSYKLFQNLSFSCNYDANLILKCFELLSKYSNIIVSIEAIDMEMDNIQPIELPHLRALTLRGEKSHLANDLYNMLLCASVCLYSLKINIHVNEQVFQCLKNNINLTELEINQQTIDALFAEDLTIKVQFKLKKLRANIQQMPADVELNFITFLQSQASTLESIHLGRAPANVFPIIFNQMPRLKKLYFETIFGSLEHLKFQENTAIETLEIRHEYMMERIRPIMDACPHIQQLYVDRISQNLLEFLSKLTRLKRVNYSHETDFDFNNNYDESLNMTLPNIIRHLEYFN